MDSAAFPLSFSDCAHFGTTPKLVRHFDTILDDRSPGVGQHGPRLAQP
jgi:hypothetical protein